MVASSCATERGSCRPDPATVRRGLGSRLDLAGSGHFTDKVRLSLGDDGRTVTVAVDPVWLATAVYPVYVDPSTGWVYNTGTNSYGDAHTASGYPTLNFDDYVRPDSPYYHELCERTDPSGTSGTSYDFLKWNLSALQGSTVDFGDPRPRPLPPVLQRPDAADYLRSPGDRLVD